MNNFEEDEPPPPYSPGPDWTLPFPQHSSNHVSPDTSHTFDCIERHIANTKHCHEIHRYGSNRFTIERPSCPRLAEHITLEGETSTTDGTSRTIFYANNHRVATARSFENYGDLTELYLGLSYDPQPEYWRPVTVSRGGLLHASSYQFRAGSRSLAWKHSHGPHLFGGAGDWILEDLSQVGLLAPAHHFHQTRVPRVIIRGQVMAVFHSKPCSWIHGRIPEYTVGQVNWRDGFGEEVELMALLTLVVILQQL